MIKVYEQIMDIIKDRDRGLLCNSDMASLIYRLTDCMFSAHDKWGPIDVEEVRCMQEQLLAEEEGW